MKALRAAYEAAYGHSPSDKLSPEELAGEFLEEIWGKPDISRHLQQEALNEIRDDPDSFSPAMRQWADDMARAERLAGRISD